MNKDIELLVQEPMPGDGRTLAIKTGIGLVTGILLALLIFVFIAFVGQIFEPDANGNTSPLVALVMVLVAFVTLFIGAIITVGTYGLLYPKKYYDSTKMFSLSLIAAGILFFLFLPLYVIYSDSGNSIPYYILAFQTLFSVFIIQSLIEFSSNPSFSGMHIIGTMMGFIISIAVYLFIDKIFLTDGTAQSSTYYLMILPPILAYTFIPLFHNLREKLYYKMYENGNNFLYLPSLLEVITTSEELNDQVKVEDQETNVSL